MWLIQLFYYTGIYSRVFFYPRHRRSGAKKPVSVIICARNEAENLEKHLPAILEQNYPEYEVIVVNDSSTDRTDEVIASFLKKYPHLKTSSIPPEQKFTHGKKLAQTIGVKAARNEILIFTDADCVPVSKNWLRRMYSNFAVDKDIVLGYGGYFYEPTFLNNYIRYDAMMIAMQYFGYALIGMPYMGVGRNLAYRKELFIKNKGFTRHYHLISGDDDLFVNETANTKNTAIALSKDSFTRSIPKSRWRDFIFQKSRHFTTSRYYKRKHKFLLGLEWTSRFFYYAGFLYLLLAGHFKYIILAAFGFRVIVQLLFIKKSMRHLNEKYLLLTSLIYDFIALIINFIIYSSILFRRRNNKWK